jgi:hypothetical protein
MFLDNNSILSLSTFRGSEEEEDAEEIAVDEEDQDLYV